MSLNVTQSNNNLTLQVSQSNVKATLSVTQNINELHITAIQNNEITKLQPVVNTNSSDFTETDPVFQASEASLFVTGDKANLDNQSGINSGDETTLSIQTKRPIKTVNGESLEGNGNLQIDYNDLDNLPTLISNHSELNLDDGTNPHGTTKNDIGLSNVDNTSDIDKPISNATQGALNNKADLVGGKVPTSQLPSYVDDVIEGYFNGTNFYTDAGFTNLITPESGKIYVNIAVTPATQYRWSGSAYVQIGGGSKRTWILAFSGSIYYDTTSVTNWFGMAVNATNSLGLNGHTSGLLFIANAGITGLPLPLSSARVIPYNCKIKSFHIRNASSPYAGVNPANFLLRFHTHTPNGTTTINNPILQASFDSTGFNMPPNYVYPSSCFTNNNLTLQAGDVITVIHKKMQTLTANTVVTDFYLEFEEI